MINKISTFTIALLMFFGASSAQAVCEIRGRVVLSYAGPSAIYLYVKPTNPGPVDIYYFTRYPINQQERDHAMLGALSAPGSEVLITGNASVCPSTQFSYGGHFVQFVVYE